MRKITLGLAVAAAALSAPAMARDGEGYFGADLGISQLQDVDIDIGTAPAVTVDHSMGYDLGAFLGYDFGMLRIEGEVAYKEYEPDTLTAVAPGIPQFVAGPPFRTGTFNPVEGELQVVTAMANAMLDFGGNHGVGFAVGVGAGHAWVESDYAVARNGAGVDVNYLAGKDHNWAWQGLAQVRIPVTERAEIGLKYRYLNTMQMQMLDSAGRTNSFELESHSALVSFIANFGAKAPPPPPPPPPAMRTCPDGTQVLATQACPVPPPPVVPRAGERG